MKSMLKKIFFKLLGEMKKDKLFFQIMKKIFLGHHKELRILILCETILTAISYAIVSGYHAVFQIFYRLMQSRRHSGYSREVLRPRALVVLLRAAFYQREQANASSAIQHTYASRPPELVRRKRQHIYFKLFHIDGDMTDGLNRICMKKHPALSAQLSNLFYRLDRAYFIVRHHNSNESRLVRQRSFYVFYADYSSLSGRYLHDVESLRRQLIYCMEHRICCRGNQRRRS